MENIRQYGKIQEDTTLEKIMRVLDARAYINLWTLEKYTDTATETDPKKIDSIDKAYQLYDNITPLYYDYIIDYIRFDFDSIDIVIKPNRWM